MDGLQVQCVRANQYEVGLLAEHNVPMRSSWPSIRAPSTVTQAESVAGAQTVLLPPNCRRLPGVQIVQRALVAERDARGGQHIAG